MPQHFTLVNYFFMFFVNFYMLYDPLAPFVQIHQVTTEATVGASTARPLLPKQQKKHLTSEML